MKCRMVMAAGFCLVCVLLVIVVRYRRQIKDLTGQIRFLRKHDSNMMITTTTQSRAVRELAELLNDLLGEWRSKEKEYEEKESRIAEIYTSLSHDIRTPLTSLDGYVQLLETSQDEEEQKRYIRIMEERIRSLKEMLEELFTYTKLQNAGYQMELSRCRLNRILKETIFSYYEEWKERGIQPDISITEEELEIMGNYQALKRTMENLIKNGLVHGTGNIRISLKRQGNLAVLGFGNQVEHPEDIDTSRVFERFYKADDARSMASTGLGLSIVKELTCKMEGKIWAELDGNWFVIMLEFPLSMEDNCSIIKEV